MIAQFHRVYLSAVLLIYLTTPLHYFLNQKCIVFSVNVCPAYIAFLSIFWFLWLGHVSAFIILSFSNVNSKVVIQKSHSDSRIQSMKCHIWTKIDLNSSVDDALLGIINEILANHVYSWYSKISSDKAFTNEVRSLLHYFVRALILRLQKCDVTRLTKLKLIPCILQHIHNYKFSVSDNRQTNEFLRHRSIGHAYSLPVYWTYAVEVLLRHVTPPNVISSSLMTSLLSHAVGNKVISQGVWRISQPLFLYRLFNQLLDPNIEPIVPQIPPSPDKPLLSLLLSTPIPLTRVLSNEELAIFIRFLHDTGELSVLRCLHDLTEVKDLLDGPKIHKEAAVYKIREANNKYFLSPWKHPLPLAVTNMDTLRDNLELKAEADIITALQESKVVHQLLEELIAVRDEYLYPVFLRSGTYRTHALSHRLAEGPCQVTKLSEDRRSSRSMSFRVIKREGMLNRNSPHSSRNLTKASTIDVPISQDNVGEKEIYRRTISEPPNQELLPKQRLGRTRSIGLENVCVNEDQLEFDLSKWDVSIKEVTRMKNIKTVYQFVIHVTRRDVTPESDWSIFRRYSEFEVLDSMLRKFFPAARLSSMPKKIMFISTQELENRRRELEIYLQSLIKCRELQRSEVVCKFLCEFNDDKLFQGENFGDHAGRVLMSLPKSFLGDRYEFLNKPFEHFIESTTPTIYSHKNDVIKKVEASNTDWEHNSAEYNRVFESAPISPLNNLPHETAHTLRSWLDICEFLADSVLFVPQSVKFMIASLKIFLPHQTEKLLDTSMSDLISHLSNESYVTYAINKARDFLYHSAPQEENRDYLKVEFETQKQIMRERIRVIIPPAVVNIFGEQQLLSNLNLVVECFGNQETNQQLIASLLDQIILELFPEIS
ncbi:Sorting nexin-14 isoform X4 [Oopsacas minuta]|uniref:Sorting nexin-14 isoform X4 n=1 Tax=Oopsacas minuta TaxID=111878 RepID=A0AAV7K1J5_9METZ|nr:Sorting nexin-14 isoform X4 [Oopsacas minuta]